MAHDWEGFVDTWFEVALADEARDGIAGLGQSRPKSKAVARDDARRLFADASNDEATEIAGTMLEAIRADGIKQWAKEATGTTLNKDAGIEAILSVYFGEDAEDGPQEHDTRRDRRAVDGGKPPSTSDDETSKAAIRCGDRRTTTKEYLAIDTTSSWRSKELTVAGRCLKCRKKAKFEDATGQNLAAMANQIKDMLNPMNWFSIATKADATRYRCTHCRYLQKICSECDEIVETTASQCKGCGHAFA